MPRATDPKRTGIRRKGTGWQAAVARGPTLPRVYRYFPLQTDPREMQAWRADVRADLHVTRKQRATRGMFSADARRYLTAVKAMPTYADREREIHLWIAEFGDRARTDITALEIRAVRDRWLTAPRSAKDKRPVSPATVNKRLRALSNLYTTLDHRTAENPVRDVPEAQEAPTRIRALPYETIRAILDAMPNRGRPVAGEKRTTVSESKLRLTVMAYTGWPPGVLAQLTAADVDLERGFAHLPARRKGKGHPAVTVPLLPEAVTALQAFADANLWGAFDARAVNRSWKRAAKACKVTGVTAYALRHSFLTAIGQASRDERAVQALAQHGDIRTTRRYTEGSVATRLDDALTAGRLHMAKGGSLS
jgi:integrase